MALLFLNRVFLHLRTECLVCILIGAWAVGEDLPQSTHFSADTAGLYQRSSNVTTPSSADVLILEDEETIVFDDKGKAVRTWYVLAKVLTKRGAESSDTISMGWDPWRQERPGLRARVITSDNVAHPLDDKTITDAPAKESQDSVFSNRRVLRAPLPAVAPGSLIEEEQTFRESSLFPSAGASERFYFVTSVPVVHTRVVVDAPATLPLHYNVQLLPDLKPQRSESDGRLRMVFEYGRLDPIDDIDPNLPSDVPAYPSLSFSTGTSWQRMGEEYSKIVDQQIANADTKSVVAKLVSGKKSRDEKAAAILQYLDREVRYTGVEFAEASVIPRTPNEILTRKYGDCKDKSALLVAMFRSANIPAYVALLNAGSREDVLPDLPGMDLFDHAIVFVPGSPDLWIDATDEYARLGQLPVADQERFALIARPGTTGLVKTPGSSSTENAVIKKREIYLADDGPARIVETLQPRGSNESFYRHAYADKESKSVKDDLSEYMKREYLADDLDRIDRTDPVDLSGQFQLVLESKRARRGVTDLSSAVAAIRYENLFNRLPPDLSQRSSDDENKSSDKDQKPKRKRTADYQLPEAFSNEWQYTIVPPAGFQPKPLPKNADLSFGPARLFEQFAADKDGTVRATFRFDTVKRRLTAQEASDLRDKVVQLLGSEPILIYFEPVGETLLNQGKTKEAFQSYHSLIAAHPSGAVHHLRLAIAFLNVGLGDAARSEARAAVKLDPNSALAEKSLAEILEYDLVGRKFRPGSDYQGAEAAFRAAIKLDPEDKATVANLAILLEFNQWGLRYGPGARLKDAITEYRKLTQQDLTDFGLQNNLAVALFHDGQFSEAEQLARTLNPEPAALIVSCEAVLNGSDAALAEARKRTGDEEKFKSMVKSAGDLLLNLRKYPLAADLESAGASGENASDTAAFASLYRITVPYEELRLPNDPAGTALRYYIAIEDPELTADKLRSLTSRNGTLAIAQPEVIKQFVKYAKNYVSSTARKGESRNVGIDLALARAQQRKVQGNDQQGYKVTLWSAANYKVSSYVVKEDGQFKVLAYAGYLAGIGLEALDRIAANDLAGARVLFDWLREDLHLQGGDDPLAGQAFPRFWTQGKTTNAENMRLTAASILTEYKQTAPQGIAILEAAKDLITNDADKTNASLALIRGYESLDQFDKALPLCQSLAKQYPESKRLFLCQTLALRALRRFDEARKLADDRLQRIPGDPDAMHSLAYISTSENDYAGIRAITQKIIDEGKADPSDLNNMAWYSLFLGNVQPSDLENALKAAQLSEKKTYSLHTLGCIYAASGKTKEAHDVLLQGMDSDDLDEPDSSYLLAFGLVAEQLGERELAVANYTRVTKPEQPYQFPGSSYDLAQLRLKALTGKRP